MNACQYEKKKGHVKDASFCRKEEEPDLPRLEVIFNYLPDH